jgi:hypothetical protein
VVTHGEDHKAKFRYRFHGAAEYADIAYLTGLVLIIDISKSLPKVSITPMLILIGNALAATDDICTIPKQFQETGKWIGMKIDIPAVSQDNMGIDVIDRHQILVLKQESQVVWGLCHRREMVWGNLNPVVHTILDELIISIDQNIADIMTRLLGRQIPCLYLIPDVTR